MHGEDNGFKLVKVWQVFPYNISQLFFYGVPVVLLLPLQIYFCHSSVKYLMIHVQQQSIPDMRAKIAALAPAFAISLTSASPICRCVAAAAVRTWFDDVGAELAGGQRVDCPRAEII